MKLHKLLILLLSFLWVTCDTNPLHPDKNGELMGNQAPETYIFLFPAPDTSAGDTSTYTGIATTVSKQILHWWGDDKDGQVVGYYYQWDYQDTPVWTTSEYDTFYVPIRTDYDEFTFQVWAVDNDSLIDPTPAVQTFPVFNSKPEIEFKVNTNPPAPPGNPDVIAYTFPTRSFFWDVTDPDGLETVTKIYYAMDDTISWIELPGDSRSITLTNLEPGEHRFYMRAEDIAGAQSEIISFPDPDDDDFPNTWEVKEPIGNVLLVNDYVNDQVLYLAQTIYEDMLTNIVGAEGYSVWEIGTTSNPQINPENSLPYATADIKAYLGYFSKVIWFTYRGDPNISAAGLSLTQYISGGGKVFISNGHSVSPDTSWTFTDIDSVYELNPDGRLFPGVEALASFTNSDEDTLNNLEVGELISSRVSVVVPGSQAEIVYRMQPDSTASVPVSYTGSPVVGIRYKVGLGESLYLSLPFHLCDGKLNMESVLKYILEEEFSQ